MVSNAFLVVLGLRRRSSPADQFVGNDLNVAKNETVTYKYTTPGDMNVAVAVNN
jgi:hypothetical protein